VCWDTLLRISIFCSRWDLRDTKCILVRLGHKTSALYFSCLGGPIAVSIKANWDSLHRTCVFASSWICGSCSAFACAWATKRQHTIFRAWVGPVWIQQKVQRDMSCRTCVSASDGICGSCRAFSWVWGTKSTYYFSCSVGPGAVSIKSVSGHDTPIMCFSSGGICGLRSAFRCVWGAKRRGTIFKLGWDWYGFDKNCTGTRYTKLVFLHPVASVGHVVHSGASGP
jgi:hypothetical protein